MFATLDAARGNGLAANQIGVDTKMFVYDVTDTDTKGTRHWGVVCNLIVDVPGRALENDTEQRHQRQHQHRHKPSDEVTTQNLTEGCLSFPGVMSAVSRPKAITVRGLDQHGISVEIHARGPLATVLQHETDHLNGIVYGDHFASQVREKMDRGFQDVQSKGTYSEDWPVGRAKSMDRWVEF